jgi:predicted transcriptional regulator
MKSKNKLIKNTPSDEKILKILKQTEKSLPSTSISLLVGLSMDRVDRILSICMRHGLCRKTTKKEVNYWKWIGDEDVVM